MNSKTCLLLSAMLPLFAFAEEKVYAPDHDAYSFPGGTWSLAGAQEWIRGADWGSEAPVRTAWDSPSDVAVIVNTDNKSVVWKSPSITIDGSAGAFEAAGIVITNNLPEWSDNVFTGDALRMGAEGLTVWSTEGNSFVTFENAIVLTASQTWRNAKVKTVDVSSTVRVQGAVSTEPGARIVWTFDGLGLVDAAQKRLSIGRPSFGLYADNAFRGETVVRNGGYLYLFYSAASRGDKLDSASDLILEGAGLGFSGNAFAYTQRVARLVLRPGENYLTGKNASAVIECGEIVREGPGSTITFPVSWAGGVTARTASTNVNAILGGWATLNDGAFAAVQANGNIGQNSGYQRHTTDSWSDNTHIIVYGSGVRTAGNVAPGSLRYANNNAAGLTAHTNDLGGATVSIRSGGVMVSTTGESLLRGGTLTSGAETGELFVFVANAFRLEADVCDGASAPLHLVKAMAGTLTCAGTLAHTGTTFLNGGTLALEGSGARLSGPVRQAGGTTLSLRDGAGLTLGAEGLDLGGNAEFGDAASLEMTLPVSPDAPAPLRFTNPFATIAVTAASAPVALTLSLPESAELRRGRYPLISCASADAATGLEPERFALSLPPTLEGALSVSGSTLYFDLTHIARGTMLMIR